MNGLAAGPQNGAGRENYLLNLRNRHFRRFDQRDHFAADFQVQVLDRARGDDRGDDAVRGLDIDFGDDRAFDDFLDLAAKLVTYIDFRDSHVCPFAGGYAGWRDRDRVRFYATFANESICIPICKK